MVTHITRNMTEMGDIHIIAFSWSHLIQHYWQPSMKKGLYIFTIVSANIGSFDSVPLSVVSACCASRIFTICSLGVKQ